MKRSSVEPWIENVGETGCLEPAFKQNTNELNRKNHVEKIKSITHKILNILRILSYQKWHLNEKTLVQINKSLIRSVIEYIGLNYNCLSEKFKKQVQTIQNSSLRIIFKKNREQNI